MRIGTLFGGCGGWDIGAWQAGAKPVWSVEFNPDIAEVQASFFRSREPSHRVVIEDVRDAIQQDLGSIDVLFASPVCKSHSKGTSRFDGDLCEHAWTGSVVPSYARIYRPRFVVVENVPDYKKHPSFQSIREGLADLGYVERIGMFSFDRYGLPQSRLRMLAWFELGASSVEALLEPSQSPSWYESTEDLLAELPPSALADWQKKRIRRMRERGGTGPYPWLVSSFNASTTRFNEGKNVIIGRYADEPAWTVVATKKAQSSLRILHEDGSVQLASVRMLARFQGFPESWEIPTNSALAIECIGNAVPPMISYQVTQTLMRAW